MKKTSKNSQYVTVAMFERLETVFEKSMRAIAQSFQMVFSKFEKIDKTLEVILRELEEHRNEARDHRLLMNSLSKADYGQQRLIHDLELRVEKLEVRAK